MQQTSSPSRSSIVKRGSRAFASLSASQSARLTPSGIMYVKGRSRETLKTPATVSRNAPVCIVANARENAPAVSVKSQDFNCAKNSSAWRMIISEANRA